MFPAGRNHDTSAGIFFGSSQKVRGANKGLGEAPKSCTRKEHESATNSIARKGQGGDFVPFRLPLAGTRDSVPCGVWGNAPTVSRALNSKGTVNKGAGSEASLPVTLRVRRRAPKLLFPQDSVKNRKTFLSCFQMKMRQDAQANLEIAFSDVEIEKSLLTVLNDISAGISDLSINPPGCTRRR